MRNERRVTGNARADAGAAPWSRRSRSRAGPSRVDDDPWDLFVIAARVLGEGPVPARDADEVAEFAALQAASGPALRPARLLAGGAGRDARGHRRRARRDPRRRRRGRSAGSAPGAIRRCTPAISARIDCNAPSWRRSIHSCRKRPKSMTLVADTDDQRRPTRWRAIAMCCVSRPTDRRRPGPSGRCRSTGNRLAGCDAVAGEPTEIPLRRDHPGIIPVELHILRTSRRIARRRLAPAGILSLSTEYIYRDRLRRFGGRIVPRSKRAITRN